VVVDRLRSGSWYFSATGLISSLHTKPTTSSPTMIENDSVQRPGR
jgi:hypothetical protein